MERYYLAVTRSTWGVGRTPLGARRNAARAGESLDTHLLYAIDVPPGSDTPFVDNAGYINYASGGELEIVARVRNRQAVPA